MKGGRVVAKKKKQMENESKEVQKLRRRGGRGAVKTEQRQEKLRWRGVNLLDVEPPPPLP